MVDFAKLSDDEFLALYWKAVDAHEAEVMAGVFMGPCADELVTLIKEALIREIDIDRLGRVEH